MLILVSFVIMLIFHSSAIMLIIDAVTLQTNRSGMWFWNMLSVLLTAINRSKALLLMEIPCHTLLHFLVRLVCLWCFFTSPSQMTVCVTFFTLLSPMTVCLKKLSFPDRACLTQVPEDPSQLIEELHKAKLPAAPRKVARKRVVLPPKESKKRRRAVNMLTATNQHMPELFAGAMPVQID